MPVKKHRSPGDLFRVISYSGPGLDLLSFLQNEIPLKKLRDKAMEISRSTFCRFMSLYLLS